MARKQNYSFQRRERDASKIAKRAAKQAARDSAKKPDSDDSVDATVPDTSEPAEVLRASE